MTLRPPFLFANRLRIIAAVLASFVAGFLPVALSGGYGLWWARILLIGSVPLIIIGLMITAIFANSIAAHPYRWATTAGLCAAGLAIVGMWAMTGSLIGIAAVLVALPAVCFFLCLARWWPGLLRQEILRASVVPRFSQKSD